MKKTCEKCGSTERYANYHCKPCTREAARLWRRSHPERAKAYRDNWVRKLKATDPDRLRSKRRKYRKPEHDAKHLAKRLKWLLAGDVTRGQLIEAFGNGQCYLCGEQIKRPSFNPLSPRGFDHVRPRIKGGKHTAANLKPCCGLCNARKATNEQSPSGSRKAL